jgi:pimeloyl-ACP methyl ester carboxylesterase
MFIETMLPSYPQHNNYNSASNNNIAFNINTIDNITLININGLTMKKIILIVLMLFSLNVASAEPLWMTLPSTPTLPASQQSGYADINGIRIWYAVYGHGNPVILLHGGLANSNYWGQQVVFLAKQYQVIVMDSRGHGRSTHDAKPYSYDLMATDVLALMDFLKIKRAAIVGWSDGAIIGLDIAIHHPEHIAKLFAFGANSDPGGTQDVSKSPVIQSVGNRAKQEYKQLSPTPDGYEDLAKQIETMWETQPHFTATELHQIKVPTWIVDGDHDEAIKRENTEWMAAQIPNAGLLILPEVSHFAFLQDPEEFNFDVLHFMKQSPVW